ncbi:hypothetical protein D3C78_753600 [compost metagenome]
MGSFKDGVASNVVNVRSRSDADAADLCSQCVGQVIPVQVQRSNNIEISWTSQNLLQCDIRNSILDNDFASSFSILLSSISSSLTITFLNHIILTPSEDLISELLLSYFITPVFEGTFSELHDVSFVNKRYTLASVFDRIFNCSAHQALRTFGGYRFDTNTRSFRETDFVNSHFFLQEFDDFLHFSRAFLIFNPCIDILCVLTENNHIHQLRTFNRRRYTLEITNWTQTYVQIQFLTQSYIQ